MKGGDSMARAVRLRDDVSAEELRDLARRSRNSRQTRRLLALAAVREGKSRWEAARIGGMDRQTLRDWVHRFNAEGAQGLLDRKAPGSVAKLRPEQKAELAELVETDPDPAVHGVVRWRRIDLKQAIRERFGVVYHERSVSRLLHEMGFSHMSARPRHPAQDGEALQTFKKTLRAPSPQP